MRITTSLGATRSPSASASISAFAAWPLAIRTSARRTLASSMPHSTGVAPAEDLHDHDRVEVLLRQDLLGVPEIDVRRVARQDVA